MIRTLVTSLCLAAIVACGNEKTTTSQDLILNPTSEQLAAAKDVGNTICPVTRSPLGSMGKPVSVIYKGQVIHFCCSGCPGEFAKNPEKYMAELGLAGKKESSSK